MPIPPPSEGNLPTAQQDESEESSDTKPELPSKVVDLLKVVPEPQRAEIISSLKEEIEVVVQEISMAHFSGPIPHPDILKGMEEVVPGSAATIIQMAVDQSSHRRTLEMHVVTGQTKQSDRGQWLGFFIAMIALIIAGILVYTGHDAAGGVIGTIDLVALVSVFVIGRSQQKEDLKKK